MLSFSDAGSTDKFLSISGDTMGNAIFPKIREENKKKQQTKTKTECVNTELKLSTRKLDPSL